ncbi:ADP-ribosyl-[dinitrogen reductase] hydrolase [Pleomorphomonas diazotrophica]|uniref:ADP-ribosyl-[dinitrogen reductase] hydrolase n=1 Tax=Pleomorphomonas diazotrophica TaxID=1166257 RepID=A0A1I4TIC6_9HYPH|nr:ADP-ribosyl-[dinitrogen reductase] hydrolase [Pleomorphomonas diazotrophica]PKR87268.1 ADP-ribosyl-[dinitrogen reductase] hydrolase [Pleomorphomonas diazotrophica]SFM76439.1 ADP-ribosyl-[dinitrogen reductase] hydrolase [Pleomorphomonas diazotrophica]
MTDPGVADRALAAFLGLAIGDALGATVEFMTPREIVAEHGVLRDIVGGGWLHLKVGAVTDDTAMSLALARSLARRGTLDLLDLCEEFAAWLKSGPPDVGNTCRRGIRRYIQRGIVTGPPNEGDAGNGAAMRILPATIASYRDPARARRWAVDQGRVTHNHPLSDAACDTLAGMLVALIAGEGRAGAARLADGLVGRYPTFRFVPYRGMSSAYVVDTLQTAFDGYFATASFEDCLIRTVNHGGDADTTGAIAGALAGATYGLEAIPKRWLKALDRDTVATIRALVPALLAVAER